MKILGIETSCDETAAAIIEDGKKILTNVVASSAEMHIKYGGVVPEVAARKQIESIIPVLTEAMHGFTKDDIDAIAVTVGPGLIGSLLVGVETAKTLAFAWNKPIIPVNHVLAHIYAVFLEEMEPVIPNSFRDPQRNSKADGILKSPPSDNYNYRRDPAAAGQVQYNKKVKFPAIALVVSGGHTELYLMKDERSLKWLGGTLDDAAGECFDKCARLLGLPYPGGPEIAAAAAKLTTDNLQLTTKFPRPMINDNSLNFSFSGLKTAVLREWQKFTATLQPTTNNQQLISAFAHEIQEAITDVLVTKTLKAASEYKVNSIIVTGGVAANQRLSQKFKLEIGNWKLEISLCFPSPKLCVDSAAYIAAYAHYQGKPVSWETINAKPDLSVELCRGWI